MTQSLTSCARCGGFFACIDCGSGPQLATPGSVVSWCPECGPEPRCDEDGCCLACGASCGEVPDWRPYAARVGALEAELAEARTNHTQAVEERESWRSEALDNLARLRRTEAQLAAFLDARRAETPCAKCHGTGAIAYGDTSTWHGGPGGQTITRDVCDECWGSGDATQRWTDLRALRDRMRALEAQIAALAYTLTGITPTKDPSHEKEQ